MPAERRSARSVTFLIIHSTDRCCRSRAPNLLFQSALSLSSPVTLLILFILSLPAPLLAHASLVSYRDNSQRTHAPHSFSATTVTLAHYVVCALVPVSTLSSSLTSFALEYGRVANVLKFTRSLALLPALFSSIAYAVHPVEVRGQDFVDTVTNKRLMIIGVDYQPGGQAGYKPQEGKDALTDADVCLRDATVMQKLGVCRHSQTRTDQVKD